ncbi:MAG: hypothetical protein ACRDL8_15010 [Solirubrobacteraceae bacterium]
MDLLAFVAAHQLVLAEHAAQLLGVGELDAIEQLEELLEHGLVARVRLSVDTPAAFQITADGASQIDGALPPPRPIDLASYAHALAAPGLSLAARRGVGQASV